LKGFRDIRGVDEIKWDIGGFELNTPPPINNSFLENNNEFELN